MVIQAPQGMATNIYNVNGLSVRTESEPLVIGGWLKLHAGECQSTDLP